MGNRFEQELAQILFDHGYWVHLLKQNDAGQPADLIAVKNGRAFLIDAKVCTNGKFPLSRIEPNQELAMRSWEERGNGIGLFALKMPDDIYMLMADFDWMRLKGITSISNEACKKCLLELNLWLKLMDVL